MNDLHEGYELVEGMLAAESPQRSATRIIEMLERGEVERVRELLRQRATRTAEAIARELASVEGL
jgi:hypothetical protein